MPSAPSLCLRVNGIEYQDVTVQLALVDGYPDGPAELVISDPLLGSIALTSEHQLELSRDDGQHWSLIELHDLIQLMNTYRADPEVSNGTSPAKI